MIRRRVVVEGRVQGVFFRDSCRDQARRLGVAGWVRNAEDGSVEAVFEGSDLPVAAMVEWCRKGPPRALVTALRVLEETPEGLQGFRISH